MYAFARVVVTLYCRLFNKVTVKGLENLPATGPVILYSNHISMFDLFLLTMVSKRQIRFMAKKSLFHVPVVNWVVKAYGAFPVDRSKPDFMAVKTALSVLKNGEQLGIFPEGTRSLHGDSASAKGGVALFASRCHADMIPIKLTYKRKVNFLNSYVITIGAPISWQELPIPEKNAEGYAAAGEWLMEKLYEL